MLEKRWISSDQVTVIGAKETQRGENLLYIGTSRFHNSIGFQSSSHCHASGPSTHGEGIDDKSGIITKVIAVSHPMPSCGRGLCLDSTATLSPERDSFGFVVRHIRGD